jgi:Right handed beta helix region
VAGLFAALCTGCATGVTDDPSIVTGTVAFVDGRVISDAGGDVEYWVEYGATTAYGSETEHNTVSVEPNQLRFVSRRIDGLQRSTTYRYRFCARDSQQQGGPGCGEDRQFTTVNVDCGDEITADLTLSGTLNCQPASDPSALVVAADGIDIDLAGHAVLGATGLDNSGGYDDVTVHDGAFEGFREAILLENASRNRLLRLRTGGGYPGSPPPNTGVAMRVIGGEDNELRDSRIHGLDGGLIVSGSDRLLVEGSRVSAHYADGMNLDADFARIRNSELDGFHGSGLVVRGSGNRIRGNQLGSSAGLHLVSGESNIVAENRAGGGAIFPVGDADNTPGGDGIFVAAAVAGTVLRANVANGSQGDGIEVLSPSTRLRDNNAHDKHLWGIDGVLGVVDLGGNTATGNGAGQCRFVAC